ncbi:hypothetical protein [Actinoplanes couchii]|uniref:Uncharacterized protein n=1 Tax=Actinoplanes couchii TaxID=403638 RepID=A0ABQ3XKZ8_9ACTN|nr:hypothetical protein [Actinoplanes couchii]MDR6319458.1 hypothetical protein [Actinoplanes couchii]GID59150.1 hypothetical protein Aco03nite_075540 [Actinoplanes couchii]
MQHFTNDDAGYLAWVAANPAGHVLNANRDPDPSHFRLHRADCRYVQGTPGNGVRWTHLYPKVCGTRPELEAWVRDEVTDGQIHGCSNCRT